MNEHLAAVRSADKDSVLFEVTVGKDLCTFRAKPEWLTTEVDAVVVRVLAAEVRLKLPGADVASVAAAKAAK